MAVWDIAQRLGHWLLAGSFLVAWVLSEGERWRQWHVVAGLIALGVVLWRLLWGAVGSRHARFSDFVRGPADVVRYLRSLLDRPEHHTGHNPAGGWAIVLLLGLTVATAVTGWLTENEIGHWAEKLHEPLANLWMLTVVVHVAGVVVSSFLHKENLVAAMLNGRKPLPEGEALHSGQPEASHAAGAAPDGVWVQGVGVVLLGASVALSLWLGLTGLPRWLGLE